MTRSKDYLFKLRVERYYDLLTADVEEFERVEKFDRIRPELMPPPKLNVVSQETPHRPVARRVQYTYHVKGGRYGVSRRTRKRRPATRRRARTIPTNQSHYRSSHSQ